jgi:hypothetical protein
MDEFHHCPIQNINPYELESKKMLLIICMYDTIVLYHTIIEIKVIEYVEDIQISYISNKRTN